MQHRWFQFYDGIYLADLYNEQVFIPCKLTKKNTRGLISCKNKEKFQLENLVSPNMQLFGRIYAVTETDGNTEKQVRLPDRNNRFPVRNVAFPQHKHTLLTIAEIRDSWNLLIPKKVFRLRCKRSDENMKNRMYPLTETRFCRCVSATESPVSAMFKFTDTWFFVLCIFNVFDC